MHPRLRELQRFPIFSAAILFGFLGAAQAGAFNVCGDGVCGSGESCSVCVADCRNGCLNYTLSSPLAKSGCAGDDDGDCLDNAGETDLAWIVAPNYYYDEDENCSGAWYTQSPNATRYGRKDFFQVRPQGPGVDLWTSGGGAKTVQITYFLLHPHDCQNRVGFGGHQGDSEHIRFLLKSQDLSNWAVVSADYYHHNRVHTFSGEYLKARAGEIGSAYASVAADEDGHGSWPGQRGSSSACAGSEDDFCFGTCDCFKGTMAAALASGYREYLAASRNVGGPCPERWRPSAVTVGGGEAYSSFDVGLGLGLIPEYWTPRSDAWKKFCGWECNLRFVSTGECAYSVNGKSGCSSALSEKIDTACFTTTAAPTCPCTGFAAASSPEVESAVPTRLGRNQLLAVVRNLAWLTEDQTREIEEKIGQANDPVAVLSPLLAGRSHERQRETLRWLLVTAPEKWPTAVAPGLVDPRWKAAERTAAAGEVLLRLSEVLEAAR